MLNLNEEVGTSTSDVAQGPSDKIGSVLKRKKKLNNISKTLLKLTGDKNEDN